MKLLIIDTTMQTGAVLVHSNGELSHRVLGSDEKHSVSLMPEIEKALLQASVNLSEIDVFGVVVGPGSFTGIRVGMATIKGFLEVFNNKLFIGATIFDIVAPYIKNGVILVQSTSQSSYFANIENEVVKDFGVLQNSELAEYLNNLQKPVFCFGDELNALQQTYNDIETIPNYIKVLEDFFVAKASAKQFNDINKTEPFYIQISQAERDVKKQGE